MKLSSKKYKIICKHCIPKVDNPCTIDVNKSKAVDPSAAVLSSPYNGRCMDAVHWFKIEKSVL